MKLTPLPFRSPLAAYEAQADELLAAFHAGDDDALAVAWRKHPRFLTDEVPWLQKDLSRDQVRQSPFDRFDARLALARWYDFESWRWLRPWVLAVFEDGSAVMRFESAVEAVVAGDVETLRALIGADPSLVRARSTRVTPFDPPQHRATLLHYIAANGVEGYRQKTPPNAVAIVRQLLEAGAEVDALADMYGGQCTTLSMLVSSSPPADAGLQTALAETLLDHGAAIDGVGAGAWTSPLMTALVFGFRDTAEMLVRRGARVDSLAASAGLGRLDDVRTGVTGSNADERHRAFALAAQMGHLDVVRVLLDAGQDPNRYNPPGFHAHATPLHHAVSGGHRELVRLLVDRGARLDIEDTIYRATPLGWAKYLGQEAIAADLAARGAA